MAGPASTRRGRSTRDLSRPGGRPPDVDVLQKGPNEVGARKLDRDDLESGRPRVLHGRDEVRVAGEQGDPLHRQIVGHGRDVQADPHVDTLLLPPRLEVRIRWLLPYRNCLGHPAAELQFALPSSEQVLLAQSLEPSIVRRERLHGPTDRLLDLSGELRAVVVESAVKLLGRVYTGVCDLLDVVRV